MCQHFLPGSKKPALRAVSLLLRGEAEFNGATLPLHLPARILQATAANMAASECHFAYLSAAWEPHSLEQLTEVVRLQAHTWKTKQIRDVMCVDETALNAGNETAAVAGKCL